MSPPRSGPFIRWLAIGQGAMYLLTGVWPLVSMRTFLAVTGPKVDLWLVRTVGVLVAVVGAGLLIAGLRRAVTLELGLIAAGCAAGLAAIDVIYVSLDRIPPIYLADAAVEAAIILLWIAAGVSARAGVRSRASAADRPGSTIDGAASEAHGR